MPPKRKQPDSSSSSSSSSSADIFKEVVFAVSGSLSTTQAAFTKKVEENGGSFASSVTKKVTHLVTTPEDVASGSAKTKKAREYAIFVVSEAFVTDSIAAGKKLDEGKFSVTAAEEEEEEEEEEKKAPAKTTRPSRAAASKKKAAAEEEEEEEEEEVKPPPSKKAKGKAPAKAAAADDEEEEKSEEEKEEEQKQKVLIKGRAAVDSVSGRSGDCHVLEEGKEIYDCMLNQTNINANNNKFYIIQVLEKDGGGGYFVWNRWGRVGERGQNKLMPMGTNKQKAIADFKKKFTDKTKNQWDNRANFKPASGKYTLIEIDYGADSEPKKEKKEEKGKEKVKDAAPAKSALDNRVQDLIKLIFDLKMMENTMMEMEFDVKKQPLGKLTKKQVKDGYAVLKDIEAAIKTGKGDLAELSSRFYTLIPHSFGRNKPPVIKNDEALKKKMAMLEALADIEIATTLLKSAESSNLNQLDANYKQLNCDITPVDEDSAEWKMVQEYVKNTHQGSVPKIQQIYCLDRAGEKARFEPSKGLGNRKMLWHGSRLTNYVGIISQGLRIAPPEAPASGYRFGKGIYFADIASLSSIYCRSAGSKDFCMLLADVALGKEKEVERDTYMEKPVAGFHSTKAVGTIEPDPSSEHKHPEGFVVPYGKIKPSGRSNVSCREHQYIVYDVSQANLRYLIHFQA